MKKVKLIVAVIFIALLVALAIFLSLPSREQAKFILHFDVPGEFVAVRDYTTEEKRTIGIYGYVPSDNESYAVGINQYDKPVFKDPNQALAALYTDYADAIDYMGGSVGNLFSGLNNQTAILNTETDDPILRDRIRFVIEFLLIFNNSFHE
jgi:hypothetical protein